MVTGGDIVRKVMAKRWNPSIVPIEEVMSSPLIMIEADESIDEAYKVMEVKKIRHLAVTRSGKLVGVVSVLDFLHFLSPKEELEKLSKVGA